MTLSPRSAIDRLYLFLSIFTDVYLIAIVLEFFWNEHRAHPTFELLLDALSQPYLGALAVYVVLKEVRKRRTGETFSLHHGERYVVLWLLLFVATTVAVVTAERYAFDVAYGLIIGNSFAALMIYLGARIHKP